MLTEGDLDALLMRQEGAVANCDATRKALVELIDAHAQTVTPKPWWRRLTRSKGPSASQRKSLR